MLFIWLGIFRLIIGKKQNSSRGDSQNTSKHLTRQHHRPKIPPIMKNLYFAATTTTTSGARREVFVHRP